MFGRLVHLSIDALIISAFLAGVKRSTGLTYVLPRMVLHRCMLNGVAGLLYHKCQTKMCDVSLEIKSMDERLTLVSRRAAAFIPGNRFVFSSYRW